jgi:purine-binding chemotaxis protein CheW
MASLHILLFDVSGSRCAIRRDAVRELLPLPRLWTPPSLPRPLAGFFNLGGLAVPVIRLDLLFGLPEMKSSVEAGLYRHLILVESQAERTITALLVDRVVDLAQADARGLSSVREAGTLNGCVEGELEVGGTLVHLLAVDKILFAEEQQALLALSRQAQNRLSEWAVTA